MTTQAEQKPFAEALESLGNRLHPKGSSVELEPIQVASIEETAQLIVDELGEQALRAPLVDLIQDLGNNPAVGGVGLVVLAGDHLNIRVLTDLSGYGEEWESNQAAIMERYDKFAESLHGTLSKNRDSRAVNSSLSYYNTAGEDVNALVPKILGEISKEVHTSAVGFVLFERPTSVSPSLVD